MGETVNSVGTGLVDSSQFVSSTSRTQTHTHGPASFILRRFARMILTPFGRSVNRSRAGKNGSPHGGEQLINTEPHSINCFGSKAELTGGAESKLGEEE